jgi:hypothetical protein
MPSYRTALLTRCYDSVRRRVDLISSFFESYAANLTHVNLLCRVSGNVEDSNGAEVGIVEPGPLLVPTKR